MTIYSQGYKMLNIQEVANFLESKLNELSDLGYHIVAEVGESNKSSLINGILRTAQAKTTPIVDYVEKRYQLVCELCIPTARTNKVFLKAQDAVSALADTYGGTKVSFENGSGSIDFTLGKPENFKVEYNVGDCTPLYFTVDLLYTENGVMSIDRKWYLDDQIIPYKSEDVLVNKEGIIRKVDFDKYTKTFLTGQTKLYKFKFPYQNTTLGNTLMKDLLDGDFTKQYTLKFVDGINYIEDSLTNPPFTTKVSIYSNGDINSNVMNVGMFDITFTDVDDGNTSTKYYIALIDWKFDASGEDTRWFTSQENQISYFDDATTGLVHVTGGTGWQQIKAPNLNSLFITSQVFPNNGTTKLNVFDLVRKNYAIIKVATTVGNVTTNKYIYYRAGNCQIGADGQVTYDLREDTVQTFMFNSQLNLSDCFVERSHLDRFVTRTVDGHTVYTYNYLKTSPLFEREETKDVSKMVVDKRRLNVAYDKNGKNSTLTTWLNTNVSHWVYYYLSYNETDVNNRLRTYDWVNGDTIEHSGLPELLYFKKSSYVESSTTGVRDDNLVHSGLTVIAFPVFKTENEINNIINGGTVNQVAQLGSASGFLKANGSAYVYAIKNSIIPPWVISSRIENTDYQKVTTSGYPEQMQIKIPTYTGTDDSLITNSWGCTFINFPNTSGAVSHGNAGVLVRYQCIDDGIDLFLKSELYKDTYTGTQVQTTANLEPKIYNEDYSTYHIYFGGQTYDMPVLKTSNYPSFKYYEPLTPDITKFYLTFDYGNTTYGEHWLSTNIYGNNAGTLTDTAPYTSKDFTGLVGAIDMSMWFSKSKLDEWLATNKNNLQIFQNNQTLQEKNAMLNAVTGTMGAGLGIGMSLMTGNVLGAIGGVASGMHGMTSAIQNRWQRENEAQNRDLTIDNMRQSPSSLSALNSNAVLIQGVDDFGIYIELQEPIPHEKQQIIDYMKRYGYTVNKIGSINSYLKSGSSNNLKRVQYVYIKALISAITGVPMSTEERLDFKQRFESGIRFWNGDSINYSLINYEYGTGA